jgi:hypothetical protein
MNDPRLLEALGNASSLELFELSTLIDRMLADPRRIIAIRSRLHLGQTVRFLDWHDGRMRTGRVVAMKDTQVTLHEQDARREWKLPYAAIEPPATASDTAHAQPAPEEPPVACPGRGDFRVGDKVAFEDRHLNTQVGTVVRINQRTATVDTGGGHSWRVSFALLRQVIDIS